MGPKSVSTTHHFTHKTFKLKHASFAIPLMAMASLAALGISFINYNPEDFASASNTVPISSTLSYNDEYITISSSSSIDLSNDKLTADASYVYTTDNVTVSTNVPTGYELYLTSTDKTSAALTSTDSGNSATIPATSGTGGELGTPKVLDKNTYGYTVPSGKIGNTAFDADYSSPSDATSKWAGIPAGSSDRIRSTNEANTSGDTTDVHYAAKLTNALPPGKYTGAVVYSAVATPTSGTVAMSVSPSTGGAFTTLTIISGPTNIDPDATLGTNEVEVTLRQNGATKYTCEVTNVDVSENKVVTTCTVPATTIGSYDVFISIPRYGFKDIASNSFGTNTLKEAVTRNNITTLQGLTSTVCSGADTWDSTVEDFTLKDSRDQNEYQIRKLKDGNCWMVQNLRLTGNSLTAAGHSTTLYASDNDTDLASGSFTIPNSAAWTSNTTTDALIAAADAPISSASGFKADSDLAYARGTYYTWPTAVLNTGSIGTSSAQTNSICPKGWDLPTYSGTLSFATAYGKYNNYANFLKAYDYYYSLDSTKKDYYLAGIWRTNGYVDNSGSSGFWWSSTSHPSNTNNAWYAGATISSIYTTDSSPRYLGLTVRCVLAGS